MKRQVDKTLEIVIISASAVVAVVVVPVATLGFTAFGAFILIKCMLEDWLFEDNTRPKRDGDSKAVLPPIPEIPNEKPTQIDSLPAIPPTPAAELN